MNNYNQQQFIVLEQWMWEDLKLNGNELIVYGLIYGLHKQDKIFYGSGQYIMNLCGCSEPTAYSILKRLVERELLLKQKSYNSFGWKRCQYMINKAHLPKQGKERVISTDQELVF